MKRAFVQETAEWPLSSCPLTNKFRGGFCFTHVWKGRNTNAHTYTQPHTHTTTHIHTYNHIHTHIHNHTHTQPHTYTFVHIQHKIFLYMLMASDLFVCVVYGCALVTHVLGQINLALIGGQFMDTMNESETVSFGKGNTVGDLQQDVDNGAPTQQDK